MRIAIVGANGFIGGRAVEMLHLDSKLNVRPIVRSYASLSRLSRFKLDWKIADARDENALFLAFEHCDLVIHAVTGDPYTILETIAPVYRAANGRGIKRLVYLSTASVHGQAPEAGTDERAPLRTDYALPYNNAKVRAERRLLKMRACGKTEVVMLRPGIVFGPRSRWVAGLANELLSGTAYFAGQDSGICNSIYVDNVVHAMQCAINADSLAVDGEAFLIGDAERVTWRQFYTPIARALDMNPDEISCVPCPKFKRRAADCVQALRTSRPVQRLLPLIPAGAKRVVKAVFSALRQPKSVDWSLPADSATAVTQEMALLHACAWQFPMDKARERLRYAPPVSFDEGMRRSIQWLAFAGYPVTLEPARPQRTDVVVSAPFAAEPLRERVGQRSHE